jgi:hypothetical protein
MYNSEIGNQKSYRALGMWNNLKILPFEHLQYRLAIDIGTDVHCTGAVNALLIVCDVTSFQQIQGSSAGVVMPFLLSFQNGNFIQIDVLVLVKFLFQLYYWKELIIIIVGIYTGFQILHYSRLC